MLCIGLFMLSRSSGARDLMPTVRLLQSGSWAFLQRGFDETPAHLQFGLLKNELAPVARYWIPSRLLRA